MPTDTKAVVEHLDPIRLATVSGLNLPTFEGWLTWEARRVNHVSRLSNASVVFLVGTNDQVLVIADRVSRYRKANRFALGACIGRPRSASQPASGVVQLRPSR